MKRIRSEKGAALIEAAITVPVILLISVGIFEFGRAYQTQQVLTNAAREGARVAVLTATTDDAVRTRVRNYLQAGSLPNYATANINVSRSVAMTGPDTGSQVTIEYPFQFMVLNPVVKLIAPSDNRTGAPITMQSSALMRNEM